jgi:hypothetical protein
VSGAAGAAGWSGELESELGLSAGLDFAAFLGLGPEEADAGEDSSFDVGELVAGIVFDGGSGVVDEGFGAAMDLLDVGSDLQEN